jgi:hypothetical protein
LIAGICIYDCKPIQLGYPLGRLLPEQIAEINEIVSENLDKKFVMAQVKELFKIKLILQEKGEWK